MASASFCVVYLDSRQNAGVTLRTSIHSAGVWGGGTSNTSGLLRLLWTFVGVLPSPPGKNSCARHFKGKHGKLYIVGKVNKCRFREKKYESPFFF